MRGFLRWVVIKEIIIANHLGAVGDWWAASAARRLGKLSANSQGDDR
tara:strand:+ start:1556 stop:1696 length:141 start_codon:yes stop_codon:yes gene_type:complete